MSIQKTNTEHGFVYECEISTIGMVREYERLPILLKALRERTGYRFKIPHGNKVRTLILEQGVCHISDPDLNEQYTITIRRW